MYLSSIDVFTVRPSRVTRRVSRFNLVESSIATRAGAQLRLPALRPRTQIHAVATASVSIANKIPMLHYADESVQNREFDLEFDAVHSRLVRRLDLVVAGELDGEESDVEDQDDDVDENEVPQ